MATIYFYRERDEPYGCFSNYSQHSFEIDGMPWATVEHYFQAQKFAGTPHEAAVRLAKTPHIAKIMGNDRERPLRVDWDDVKDDVMRLAVRRKFETHADIRAILLSTGTTPSSKIHLTTTIGAAAPIAPVAICSVASSSKRALFCARQYER